MADSRSDPKTSSSRGKFASVKVWLAVAWLVGYSLFFFSFTLPNSNPPVRRVDVWLELPEVLWSNIVTPPNGVETSWANLGQRLDLIAVAITIWLGSWAVGSLILRAMRVPQTLRSAERGVCACGLGLSLVSLLTLGCGLGGWLSPVLLGGVLAVALLTEITLRVGKRGGVSHSVNLSHDQGADTAPFASAASAKSSLSERRAKRDWLNQINGVLTRGEQIPYDLVCKSLAVIAMTLFCSAMLLGSLLPPTDFDVKAYHLTGPKEYFLNGRITFLEHNVYTSFPFLTEMLCLLGMVLRQDWFRGALAGQAVLMGFAPLAALALFCAGRRWFSSTVGWLAATIYLSTPWTYRLAIIAYVEGALSCYLFLTLFVVMLALELRSLRMFVVAGLLAGSAMACKYPGLVSAVIPMGLAVGLGVWRQCRPLSPKADADRGEVSDAVPAVAEVVRLQASDSQQRPPKSHDFSTVKALLAFGVGVAITIGPWLLKNVVETGNPVYPLAYGLFGGRDWDASSHAKWRRGHSPKSFALINGEVERKRNEVDGENSEENRQNGDGEGKIKEVHRTLVEYFIDVTAMADWLSPLLFGLAPLAWLASPRACKSQILNLKSLIPYLWLYVAFLFIQWWLLTHRIDRFWVPLIPVVALLAAVGVEWSQSKLWRWACGTIIALSVLFNLGFITTNLCGFNAYLADLDKARSGCESTAEGISYLNQLHDTGKLPLDAKILCVGEAQVFDARPRVIYNTVFDQPILRDWLAERPVGDVSERDWPLRPIDDVRRQFESHGVTHVLVNWQELLRYRMTYGYSDFVTPSRFTWLRENGLLGDPEEFSRGMRDYDGMDGNSRAELDRWAPELKRQYQGKTVYLAWQVFAVRKMNRGLAQIIQEGTTDHTDVTE